MNFLFSQQPSAANHSVHQENNPLQKTLSLPEIENNGHIRQSRLKQQIVLRSQSVIIDGISGCCSKRHFVCQLSPRHKKNFPEGMSIFIRETV